jgi:hypothetical protein
MAVNTPLWIFGQSVGRMAASIILSDLVVAASTRWISRAIVAQHIVDRSGVLMAGTFGAEYCHWALPRPSHKADYESSTRHPVKVIDPHGECPGPVDMRQLPEQGEADRGKSPRPHARFDSSPGHRCNCCAVGPADDGPARQP